jgi:hypothetical protein
MARTRRQQREDLDKQKIREGLEQSEQLRLQGKGDEADQILIQLAEERGVDANNLLPKPREPVDEALEKGRQLLRDHNAEGFYDFVKAGGLDVKQMYRIQSGLTPDEERTLDRALEFTTNEDMGAS